jgi:hypothetical protein
MNWQEYSQLQAEKGALERLLADLPADREIERIGLEARRQEVVEALASLPSPSREPLRARLTFRGKPIIGSHGIFAEFGAQVVGEFSEAVVAIGASQVGPLGSRGILPGRDDFRMLITGTTPGSFGFQLEEAPTDNFTQQKSPLESAIHQAKAIMQASLGTDDELTEALSEADPRALEAMRKFLETMAKSEAVCALEFKGEVFRFSDVEQVRRSTRRLRQDNIHEQEESFAGIFQGVLPHQRTFEFLVSDTDEIISGKVGKEIEDVATINQVLDKPVTIVVNRRRIGEGRPRFILLRYQVPHPNDK